LCIELYDKKNKKLNEVLEDFPISNRPLFRLHLGGSVGTVLFVYTSRQLLKTVAL
jgi:hypothetical protein